MHRWVSALKRHAPEEPYSVPATLKTTCQWLPLGSSGPRKSALCGGVLEKLIAFTSSSGWWITTVDGGATPVASQPAYQTLKLGSGGVESTKSAKSLGA